MERRLVLFFVLVALIMWLSQKLMPSRAPRQSERYRVTEVDSTEIVSAGSERTDSMDWSSTAVPGDTVMLEPPSSWELFEDFVPAKDETVIVTTEDLQLTIASRGGTVAHCVLPQFLRKDDGVVSLFPESYGGLLGVTLKKGGEEHDLSDLPYSLDVKQAPEAGIAARIRWTAQGRGGVRLRKELEVPEKGYSCRFRVEARGLGLAGYSILFPPGLQSTEKNERDDHSYFKIMGGVAGKAWEKKLRGTKAASPHTVEGPMDWAGVRTKYFIVALVPDSLSWHRVTSLGGSDMGALGMKLEGVTRGGVLKEEYTLYIGPVEYSRLALLGRGVVRAVDMGNKYLRPIGRLVLLFLTQVHTVIPNYGIVIMLFAVAMKILLHPLTRKSMQSMKKMQELQPKMAAIKEKYKNNAQKQQQETMKLYREHGVNPLGGCLPLVLQMPIFFAMYPVLRSSIYLRGATFIPGIVEDLSQGNPILPILMGITQFISTKMMATDNQNKMLMYGMPVFMTYIFFRLPSGLVLYWFTYNLLQIVQQLWQKQRAKSQAGIG